MKFGWLAALVAVAGLVVAGCGGGGGSGSTTTSQAAMRDKEVKYSQCMREHGVKNFPDPQPDGGMLLKAGPGTGINPESQQFKAAQQACQKLQPKAGAKFDRAKAQQMEQAALKFAQCMRAHGVNFPDPQFQEGGAKMTFGGPGINPNDPKFKAAQQACAKNLPGGGPGGGGAVAFGAAP
jgi:hypothetical protein